MLELLTNAFLGPRQARAAHRQSLRAGTDILAGVRQLTELTPNRDVNDAEAPIFLLSAGWRSGSTMMQRLLMSDPRVLIWGEPYDECGLIQAMAASMRAFRAGWPPGEYFYDGRPSDQLTGEWIANLFPSLESWRMGQRALFDTLFAQPAKAAGAPRWGIKEVRLTAEHCHYLRWLYPNARFILLYRNPLEAYRSYCRYGRSWYDTYPEAPVFTPKVFGEHWRRLMQGYLAEAANLDALMVRYEDLIAGRMPVEDLDRHLDIQVDPGVLKHKVGSSERGGNKFQVNWLERQLLKRAVAPVARNLGYHW